MNPFLVALQASLATNYRIDRELGARGMATVYLAHDIKQEQRHRGRYRGNGGARLNGDSLVIPIRQAPNIKHPAAQRREAACTHICAEHRSYLRLAR